MKVIYGRISTSEQNEERQKVDGLKSFIDNCSGNIPFFERPQAKELMKFLRINPGAEVSVLAVDRLGRNTMDVLKTVQYFKANGYTLSIENLGQDNTSPFFEMMVSILGTLAQQEKQTTLERCKQGIAIAKEKGLYQGRKKGTKDSRTKTLEKHSDIVICLSRKMTISDTAQVTNKTRATIYKVKKLL
jgi:DNA invertase Pin-like site-specific DNA recombinase